MRSATARLVRGRSDAGAGSNRPPLGRDHGRRNRSPGGDEARLFELATGRVVVVADPGAGRVVVVAPGCVIQVSVVEVVDSPTLVDVVDPPTVVDDVGRLGTGAAPAGTMSPTTTPNTSPTASATDLPTAATPPARQRHAGLVTAVAIDRESVEQPPGWQRETAAITSP